MKVAVFGLGYVGSVTAAALARDGHEVVGVDPSEPKVTAIRRGRAPVLEPGLDELMTNVVDSGRLTVTFEAGDAMAGADVSIICVGTPSRSDGALDFSQVRSVAEQIGERLATAAADHTVVVRSTVLAGTTRSIVIPAVEEKSGRGVGQGWEAVVNPEFLREGSSLADYDKPIRILIGERAPGAGDRAALLYEGIDAPSFRTPLEVAESIKYADNAFHALKIGFANEIARFCESRGVDPDVVMDIVCSDTRQNISRAYLRPGFAFGGSCLPKDLRALTVAARRDGVALPMLEALLPSNEAHIRRAVDGIVATGHRKVALLGLAFKPGTDDLRESPLIELAERLIGKGFELTIHDPAVSLGQLHGKNRAFLEERVPHIQRLLHDTLDAATDPAELIVIGHADPRYDQDGRWRAAGKAIIRLA